MSDVLNFQVRSFNIAFNFSAREGLSIGVVLFQRVRTAVAGSRLPIAGRRIGRKTGSLRRQTRVRTTPNSRVIATACQTSAPEPVQSKLGGDTAGMGAVSEDGEI